MCERLRHTGKITPRHSSGSEISLLEREWTFFFGGVVPDEKRRSGVGLLTGPWLFASERVAYLCLLAGEQVLTVVFFYAPNSSSEYPTFWSPWKRCRRSPQSGYSPEYPDWGLHHPTRRLQCSCGQGQRDLEGRDLEERTVQSEPEWCLVIGFLN